MRPTLCILAVAFLSASVGASGADTISGCYKGPKYIATGLDGDAASKAAVFNTLAIRAESPGSIEFDIELISDWGHVCTARQHAKHVEGQPPSIYLFSANEQPQDSAETVELTPTCRLQFQSEPSEITVQAVGGQCDAYFGCGARTSLNRLSFSRATKVALNDSTCKFPEP